MLEEDKLIDKLRKIEALFARPGTEGERLAAGSARDRIQGRLREIEQEKPTEFRFTVQDAWSRSLMLALLRRYGLTPYRYRGQRATTVMVRAPQAFIDETVWPQFQQLNATLRSYLDEVTRKVIATAICGDTTEAEERSGGSENALSG